MRVEVWVCVRNVMMTGAVLVKFCGRIVVDCGGMSNECEIMWKDCGGMSNECEIMWKDCGGMSNECENYVEGCGWYEQ
ncbi:hypothetical protein HNY73_021986 [Argiope bruennichi]|uniref:Uncharacterized protein n=1 Tax=Argiope bruennichi TaxID=94029 RepID=A0A8T0E1Q6_ARGBR|nr:hypothetical protein HNY73_021986 [Argiope bruennichi]